ncbi:UNVERIFIED_CONTAM: hypothetical protein FKN15_067278 [Acipenser sinensis]
MPAYPLLVEVGGASNPPTVVEVEPAGIHPLLVEVGGASSPPTAVESEPAGIHPLLVELGVVSCPPTALETMVRAPLPLALEMEATAPLSLELEMTATSPLPLALETAAMAPLLLALETAEGPSHICSKVVEHHGCDVWEGCWVVFLFPGLPALPISRPQEVDHSREGDHDIPLRRRQPVPDPLRGDRILPPRRMRVLSHPCWMLRLLPLLPWRGLVRCHVPDLTNREAPLLPLQAEEAGSGSSDSNIKSCCHPSWRTQPAFFPGVPGAGRRIIGGGPVQMGHLLTGVGTVRWMATTGKDTPTTRARSSCKPRPRQPPHHFQHHHLHHHPKNYGTG